ncbi:MAG: hypothetical protein ACK5RL_05300, partial [Acidimicrobiales bacterium]
MSTTFSSRLRRGLILGAATVAATTAALAPASPAAAADPAALSSDTSVVGVPGSTMYPFAEAVISGVDTMDGITIRIDGGFDAAVDQMGTSTTHAGITVAYDSATGLLRLRGTAPTADYQAALRDVTYTQTTTTEGSRTFTVVAGRAIYLPAT